MINEILFNHIKTFIFNAIPIIEETLSKSYFKPRFQNYPQVTFRKSKLPDISEIGSSPIKISNLFNSYTGKPEIDIHSIDGYKQAFNELLAYDEYRKGNYVTLADEAKSQDLYETIAEIFLSQVLERYYLTRNISADKDQHLSKIFTELENYYCSENLDFDISIPILFVHFDFDEFQIGENVIIRRISDDYHKARIMIRNYSPPISPALISSATHEFVLKNYYVKNPKDGYFTSFFSNELIYPVSKFDLFINSIKIETDINSGYAQLLIYPHNWAEKYHSDLPVLDGISVKKYPNYFDNYYWNKEEIPSITEAQMSNIGNLYLTLSENIHNKLIISNKRLRYSYLRDNEEDAILDIIIALETLLGDNERGEIIHKLALRISILLKTYAEGFDPLEVLISVKRIYDYRSAIVHGSSKAESKREILLHKDKAPIKTIQLANSYLREIIKIIVQNPKFLESKEIDKLLLM